MIDFKQFVADFKQSKYWGLLFDKYKVLLIHAVGSQLNGYIDDHSDIDLVVVCEDSPLGEEQPLVRLSYDGVTVHWYFRNYRQYFELYDTRNSNQMHSVMISSVTADKILYIDDRFIPAFDFLLSKKQEISYIAAKRITLLFNEHITKTIQSDLSKKYYTKWLSQLLLCYSTLTGRRLDNEFFLAIKRIRWQPTTEEQRLRCCKILKELQQLVSNDSIDALTAKLQYYNEESAKLLK